MILQTAAFIAALGLVTFVVGHVIESPGVSMIGAIIVIGLGATAMTGGVQVAVGSDVQTTSRVIETSSDDLSNSSLTHTLDISDHVPDPTGVEFTVTGDRMFVSGYSTSAVHVYSSGDFDISFSTHERDFNVSGEDPDPTGIEFSHDGANGDHMYVTGESTATIYQYTLGEPYNVSTASLNNTLNVSALDDQPRAVDFDDTGTNMYMVGAQDTLIHHFELSEPWNVSTATQIDTHDISSQVSTPTGFGFNDDGTRMLLTGSSKDAVFQYKLDTAFEFGSSSYTGHSLDVRSEAQRPSGLHYADQGRELFVSDRKSGVIAQYDTGVDETVEDREEDTVYRDIDTQADFPPGVVIVGLGAVMLLSGAGRASEEDLKVDD